MTYRIDIFSLTTEHVTKSCIVGFNLMEETEAFTRLVCQYEYKIPKPYETHNLALDWEIRKLLKVNGHPDITYSAEPPTGVLPEQNLAP